MNLVGFFSFTVILLCLAVYGFITRKNRFLPRGIWQWTCFLFISAIAAGAALVLFSAYIQKGSIKHQTTFYKAYVDKYAEDLPFVLHNGKERNLRDYRGRLVVLNFWATWCPSCQTELPVLAELESIYGLERVAVVALSQEPADWVKAYLKKLRVELSTGFIAASPELPLIYRQALSAIPTTFIIDKEGRMRDFILGSASSTLFKSKIDPLLE